MSDGWLREELFARLCSKNSSPNVRSGYRSARQGPDLELLFPNFLGKFYAAYRYCPCVESLEPEHRSNPLFDAAMILLHRIVQVLARSYPYTARYRSHHYHRLFQPSQSLHQNRWDLWSLEQIGALILDLSCSRPLAGAWLRRLRLSETLPLDEIEHHTHAGSNRESDRLRSC